MACIASRVIIASCGEVCRVHQKHVIHNGSNIFEEAVALRVRERALSGECVGYDGGVGLHARHFLQCFVHELGKNRRI